MRRYLFFLPFIGLYFATAGSAQAETLVNVVATDPSAVAKLGRNETFYLRIQYTSDEPISIC